MKREEVLVVLGVIAIVLTLVVTVKLGIQIVDYQNSFCRVSENCSTLWN